MSLLPSARTDSRARDNHQVGQVESFCDNRHTCGMKEAPSVLGSLGAKRGGGPELSFLALGECLFTAGDSKANQKHEIEISREGWGGRKERDWIIGCHVSARCKCIFSLSILMLNFQMLSTFFPSLPPKDASNRSHDFSRHSC